MEKNPFFLFPIRWRSAQDVGILPISTMGLVLSIAFNYLIIQLHLKTNISKGFIVNVKICIVEFKFVLPFNSFFKFSMVLFVSVKRNKFPAIKIIGILSP